MNTWRPVEDFDGLYEVSSTGCVRNARTLKELRHSLDKDGYCLVALYRGKPTKSYTRKVHRLVATAFHGPATKHEPEVDHKDLRRDNNNVGNLRWASVSKNRRNIRPRGASGILGVRCLRGRWQAYAKINNKFTSFGWFATKAEAAKRRKQFEQEIGL